MVIMVPMIITAHNALGILDCNCANLVRLKSASDSKFLNILLLKFRTPDRGVSC